MDCSHQPPLGMKKQGDQEGTWSGLAEAVLSVESEVGKPGIWKLLAESANISCIHLDSFGNHLTLIASMSKKVTLTYPDPDLHLAACHWVIETQISISGRWDCRGAGQAATRWGLSGCNGTFVSGSEGSWADFSSVKGIKGWFLWQWSLPCTLRTQRFRKTLQWKKNSGSSSTFDEVKMECLFCHITHIERH